MTAIMLIKVVLELRAPGGVAAPEQFDEQIIDLRLARDKAANVHVAGASLAGSLRAHLGSAAGSFMGAAPGAEEISASCLWFLGTTVEAGELMHRTRTAIDRERAAPAATMLRSSEHLPPGTRITAFLRLDETSLGEELLQAVTTWRPSIGGGRTVGHGQAEVVDVRHRLIDLATSEGRRAWLTGGGPALFADELTEPVPLPTLETETLRLPRDWEIVDGLHIGTGGHDVSGKEDESSPAQIVLDSDGKPYIPGSTWKGVLRSRCEFILRSLDAPACAPGHGCGDCLICATFGYVSASGSARGLLAFTDSRIEDAEPVARTYAPQDRVFGGAAAGLLHSRHVVESGRFTLRVEKLGDIPLAAVALLTLACYDLHHGYAGIGGSTTRGLGTIAIRDGGSSDAERRQAFGVLREAIS